MKALFPVILALAAPAAFAWTPCDQAGITPPVVIRRDAPAYPAAVRAIGVEGSVEVALTILRDGRVGWARVLRADPQGYFEQAALAGVRAWRFEPARANGEPIECRMQTRVRFTLVDTVDSASETAANHSQPEPAYPAPQLVERIESDVELQFEVAPDGCVARALRLHPCISESPADSGDGASDARLRPGPGPPTHGPLCSRPGTNR